MSKQHVCYNAGGYYFQDSRDTAKAIAYWERSCYHREYALACFFLGKFYLDDKNAEHKDKEKALQALEKGCILDEENALDLGCKQGIKICCEKKKAQAYRFNNTKK